MAVEIWVFKKVLFCVAIVIPMALACENRAEALIGFRLSKEVGNPNFAMGEWSCKLVNVGRASGQAVAIMGNLASLSIAFEPLNLDFEPTLNENLLFLKNST